MSSNNISRNARIYEILKNLQASTLGVLGCALSSADGYPIASELPSSIDEARLAALSAAMIWTGQQVTEGLAQGGLVRIFIESDRGDMIVTNAGPESMLTAIVSKDANLGLTCVEMQNSVEDLAALDNEVGIDINEPMPMMAAPGFDKALDRELGRLAVGE